MFLTNEIITTYWALYVRHSKCIILFLLILQNKISKDKLWLREFTYLLKITEITRTYHARQPWPILMHCDLKPNKDFYCAAVNASRHSLCGTLPSLAEHQTVAQSCSTLIPSSSNSEAAILKSSLWLNSSHSGSFLKDLN